MEVKETHGEYANEISGYSKIIIETDEENPVTIAVITSADVESKDGYRVRMTPVYD